VVTSKTDVLAGEPKFDDWRTDWGS
jgi:hypothetical protein